jgi:hypothetical protein
VERGALSVQQLLSDQASALVQSNRLKLLSILKTIVFCGRQMIPLRGHREQADSHSNPGNFHALLDFRIDAGDAIVADNFEIQNGTIKCTIQFTTNTK